MFCILNVNHNVMQNKCITSSNYNEYLCVVYYNKCIYLHIYTQLVITIA